jgi:hypothetical protein
MFQHFFLKILSVIFNDVLFARHSREGAGIMILNRTKKNYYSK